MAIIIVTLGNLPQPEREDVVKRALELITPTMDGYERGTIIYTIRDVPVSNRGDVIRDALELFKPTMRGTQFGDIIIALPPLRKLKEWQKR